METSGWIVLLLFFGIMVLIGLYSLKKVKNTTDFFLAGGNLPWWLAGISHHVSGYSGVVFVGYAAIAYTHGITIYFWWALPIALGVFIGSYVFAPRWTALRTTYGVQSPTEYLQIRYNRPTQQLIAWMGVILKLFDVGAKWTALAILLNGFAGVSLGTGILLSGGISLLYISIGGLWADIWTDFAQFVVQIIAGLVMFFVIWQAATDMGGWGELWARLPAENLSAFHEPYTPGFMVAFIFIFFLSYNGGMWNLATRFIASETPKASQKAARLSAVLYLIWPLILFVPMWLAPVLIPDLANPEQSYIELTKQLLPPALVGLVLASMFANTMSMTTSDSNTVSAVIVRDIIPIIFPKFRDGDERHALRNARLVTAAFIALTLLIAWFSDFFGGILGLVITWFGGLVGPASVPMLLGLLPLFRRSGPTAAWASILGGVICFAILFGNGAESAAQLGYPLLVSFILYTGIGLVFPEEQKQSATFEIASDEIG